MSCPVVMDATGLENRRTDRHSRVERGVRVLEDICMRRRISQLVTPGVAKLRPSTVITPSSAQPNESTFSPSRLAAPEPPARPESRPWRDRNSRDRPPAAVTRSARHELPRERRNRNRLVRSWTLSSVSLTRHPFAGRTHCAHERTAVRGRHPHLETHVTPAHSGRRSTTIGKRLPDLSHRVGGAQGCGSSNVMAGRLETRDHSSNARVYGCCGRAHISSTGPASTT